MLHVREEMTANVRCKKQIIIKRKVCASFMSFSMADAGVVYELLAQHLTHARTHARTRTRTHTQYVCA